MIPGRAAVLPLVLIIGLATWPTVTAPLQEAAKRGQVDTAAQLIKDGADLDARDETGETPLTAAALAGQTEVVGLLIESGAHLDGRNGKGFTALHAAVYGGHLEIVELLLDRGAAVDDQDNTFEATPLHMAAEENRLEIADLLITEGAPLEVADSNHHTPASKAAFRLHEEMVILLRLSGAGCQSRELMGLRYRLFCLGHGG